MKEYIVQAIEQETIDSFDAHNAPELIRCKDCKYCKAIDWDDSNPYYGSCQYFNTHTVDADGFCYKAERKGSE